jgi:hypothetical protein
VSHSLSLFHGDFRHQHQFTKNACASCMRQAYRSVPAYYRLLTFHVLVLSCFCTVGKSVQTASYLGAMVACRKLDSVLIICPATILDHWLRELSVWAPGLRRVLVHKSGENDGFSRSVSPGMLSSLSRWLQRARSECMNESLGDDDNDENENEDKDTFCGA